MKPHRRTVPILSILAALMLLLPLAGACDSGDEEQSAEPAGATAVAAVAGGAITIVARDNVYVPSAFSGPANQEISMTLDNRGAALHNFAIVGQRGPDGQEIQTILVPAGQQDTIAFTLPAGGYEFYCPVHPAEMRGRLTIQ